MRTPGPPRPLEWLVARVVGRTEGASATLGDLEEGYRHRSARSGRLPADVWYLRQGLSLMLHLAWAGDPAGAGRAERLGTSLRWAVKSLVRRPVFTLAVTSVLAVALAATTAAFSVARGTFEAALWWQDDARTVLVWPGTPFSRGQLDVLQSEATAFEVVGGMLPGPAVLSLPDRTESTSAVSLSPALFQALRARPALGRGLQESDASVGAEPVAVLGHALWERSFGADPAVLGQVVEVNGLRRRIVGVMPRGARHPGMGTEVWTPLVLDAMEPDYWPARELEVVAVMAPGVGIVDARDDVRRVLQDLAARFSFFFQPDYGTDATVVASNERAWGAVEVPLVLLLGGTALLLLVAAIDVGNLVLARSLERRTEFQVRAAVGATRGQVVRQIAAEAGLKACMAGAAGWALGALLAQRVPDVFPGTVRVVAASSTSPEILLFVGMATALAWLLMGGIPAAHFLVSTRRTVSPTRGGGAPRGLVVAQAALATVLLVTSGLLMRTIRSMEDVSLGFEPADVTAVRVIPPSELLAGTDLEQVRDELAERAAATAGAVGAGWISAVPLLDPVLDQPVNPERRPTTVAEAGRAASIVTDQGALEALAVALVEGRGFQSTDVTDAPPVALVSRSLARRLWPEQSAVGQRMAVDPHAWDSWVRVVGVVEDVRHESLILPAGEAFYQPRTQAAAASMSLIVASSAGPAEISNSVRRALEEIAPGVPAGPGRSMTDVVQEAQGAARVLSILLGILAGLATVLGAVGLYGSLAGWVARRRRELGTRLALGASPGALWMGVIGSGVLLTSVGVALGGAGAALVGRSIQSLLHGVGPLDPPSFLIAAAILLVTGIVAAVLPAMRAASVPPAQALRSP